MLLPDNVNPDDSIYYNGFLILKKIKDVKQSTFIELYFSVEKERKITMSVFMLSISWLFLIDMIDVDDSGVVKLCSSNN